MLDKQVAQAGLNRGFAYHPLHLVGDVVGTTAAGAVFNDFLVGHRRLH